MDDKLVKGLKPERLNHSLAVGRKMAEIVNRFGDKYNIPTYVAFTLGYVHDIGYEYALDKHQYSIVGGSILQMQNYPYWKEVYYHGSDQHIYSSDLLDLLNYADMTTGPNGEDMTFDERLSDIADRYGDTSISYIDAVKLIELLKKKGFK